MTKKKGVKKPCPKRKKAKKAVVKLEPPTQEEVVDEPLVCDGPRCACGKEVAQGQSAVCKDHIRTN